MSDEYHASNFRPPLLDIIDDPVRLEDSFCAASWPTPQPDDDLDNQDAWWEFTGFGPSGLGD